MKKVGLLPAADKAYKKAFSQAVKIADAAKGEKVLNLQGRIVIVDSYGKLKYEQSTKGFMHKA